MNNGGGLSEQAIVFSAGQYQSFLHSCLKVPGCGGQQPAKAHLEALLTCGLPGDSRLRFATIKDEPELRDQSPYGKPYVFSIAQNLLINRHYLYTEKDEPLKVPGAIGYLSRIYLDYCRSMPFEESEGLAKTLAAFADFDSEQVTVGKDDLNLPFAKWIRLRTLYSDLIIEASDSILRLSCGEGDLGNCSLVDGRISLSQSRFKNLSLVRETKENSVISFAVEGSFLVGAGAPQLMKLAAEFKDGKPLRVSVGGKSLELPKEQD